MKNRKDTRADRFFEEKIKAELEDVTGKPRLEKPVHKPIVGQRYGFTSSRKTEKESDLKLEDFVVPQNSYGGHTLEANWEIYNSAESAWKAGVESRRIKNLENKYGPPSVLERTLGPLLTDAILPYVEDVLETGKRKATFTLPIEEKGKPSFLLGHVEHGQIELHDPSIARQRHYGSEPEINHPLVAVIRPNGILTRFRQDGYAPVLDKIEESLKPVKDYFRECDNNLAEWIQQEDAGGY